MAFGSKHTKYCPRSSHLVSSHSPIKYTQKAFLDVLGIFRNHFGRFGSELGPNGRVHQPTAIFLPRLAFFDVLAIIFRFIFSLFCGHSFVWRKDSPSFPLFFPLFLCFGVIDPPFFFFSQRMAWPLVAVAGSVALGVFFFFFLFSFLFFLSSSFFSLPLFLNLLP